MIIDTHRFVENLVAAGFKKKQAEVFVKEMNENQKELATKEDLQIEVKSIRSETATLKWMVGIFGSVLIMMVGFILTKL